MNLLRGIKAAWLMLTTDGPVVLLRAVWRRLREVVAPCRPDEPTLAYQALKTCSVKGTMIDVGAHHGGSLAPFARDGWTVYAFEPNSENRERLRKLFGRLSNLTIDPRAVSNRVAREVPLYGSRETYGVNCLNAFGDSQDVLENIDVVTLETALSEHGVDSVDFLKIDSEGHDLFVLQGFPWARCEPRMVVCEFEEARTAPLGYGVHDLATFLKRRGYEVIVSEWHPIKRYGVPHDWKQFSLYPCEIVSKSAWGNLIATKDKEVGEAIRKGCRRFGPVRGCGNPS